MISKVRAIRHDSQYCSGCVSWWSALFELLVIMISTVHASCASWWSILFELFVMMVSTVRAVRHDGQYCLHRASCQSSFFFATWYDGLPLKICHLSLYVTDAVLPLSYTIVSRIVAVLCRTWTRCFLIKAGIVFYKSNRQLIPVIYHDWSE